VSKADLGLQCGMPCSKLEVSTVQHGTLSGAGYLHQSQLKSRWLAARRDEAAVVEVLEQSDRAGPSGRETANRHDAGLKGLCDRGDYDRRYRIDASHPQGTIRTGRSGCPRPTWACSVECRAPSLKSRQHNTGRFPAPAICTRARPPSAGCAARRRPGPRATPETPPRRFRPSPASNRRRTAPS
jgi:hypothetical protein